VSSDKSQMNQHVIREIVLNGKTKENTLGKVLTKYV